MGWWVQPPTRNRFVFGQKNKPWVSTTIKNNGFSPISMMFQPLGFSNGGYINPPIVLMVGKESQGKHDIIDPFILQELPEAPPLAPSLELAPAPDPEVLPPEPEIQGHSVLGRGVWLSQLVSNGESWDKKCGVYTKFYYLFWRCLLILWEKNCKIW